MKEPFGIAGELFYSREQRAKRTCLHVHLATAARVKYPAALLRCKFECPVACCGVFDLHKLDYGNADGNAAVFDIVQDAGALDRLECGFLCGGGERMSRRMAEKWQTCCLLHVVCAAYGTFGGVVVLAFCVLLCFYYKSDYGVDSADVSFDRPGFSFLWKL